MIVAHALPEATVDDAADQDGEGVAARTTLEDSAIARSAT